MAATPVLVHYISNTNPTDTQAVLFLVLSQILFIVILHQSKNSSGSSVSADILVWHLFMDPGGGFCIRQATVLHSMLCTEGSSAMLPRHGGVSCTD